MRPGVHAGVHVCPKDVVAKEVTSGILCHKGNPRSDSSIIPISNYPSMKNFKLLLKFSSVYSIMSSCNINRLQNFSSSVYVVSKLVIWITDVCYQLRTQVHQIWWGLTYFSSILFFLCQNEVTVDIHTITLTATYFLSYIIHIWIFLH